MYSDNAECIYSQLHCAQGCLCLTVFHGFVCLKIYVPLLKILSGSAPNILPAVTKNSYKTTQNGGLYWSLFHAYWPLLITALQDSTSNVSAHCVWWIPVLMSCWKLCHMDYLSFMQWIAIFTLNLLDRYYQRGSVYRLGPGLLCSNFYLPCFWALLKIFTHYVPHIFKACQQIYNFYSFICVYSGKLAILLKVVVLLEYLNIFYEMQIYVVNSL